MVYVCNNINKGIRINMNILFYAIVFMIGIVVGSYWAIKAEEIPKILDMKKIDNKNEANGKFRSRLTYILIGGVLSVILAYMMNIRINELDMLNVTIYVFEMLYISALVLIAGIDKSYLKIDKGMLAFGIVSSIIYMVYLCMIDLASINLNVVYLLIYIILLVIDSFLLRRYAKDSYIINILLLMMMILVYTDLRILTYTLTMALMAILIYTLILKIQKKRRGNKKIKLNEIPVGYYIAASNIIVLVMIKVFENYCI